MTEHRRKRLVEKINQTHPTTSHQIVIQIEALTKRTRTQK